MRLLTKLVVATFVTTALFTACKPADPKQQTTSNTATATATASPVGTNSITQPTNPADAVPRITSPELQKELASGDAVVVDVRSDSQYKAGHIKGAKFIPAGEVGNRINELPRDKKIVTYCS
jgi:3-mercaptopyruvate sulfurtransferase SseA